MNTRAPVACLALVVLAVATQTSCAHARGDDGDVVEIEDEGADDALNDLEAAFRALRRNKHKAARALLERATARFDDLALATTPIEQAFAADASKPYRGRPHERVLATTVLAALDMERGRCDLAIPTLRNAVYLDARSNPDEASDAVLVHTLALRCLARENADKSDSDRAREELKRALALTGDDARFAELEAAALGDVLVLALDGTGPTVVSEGVHGERARIVPATTAKAGRVESVVVKGPRIVRIHLGSGPSRGSRGSGRVSRGLTVWSSTQQATTIGGRPYEAVLAQRARDKTNAINDGRASLAQGRQTVVDAARRRDAKGLLAGALFTASGAGLTVLGAATDARADVRYVRSLFERASLLSR